MRLSRRFCLGISYRLLVSRPLRAILYPALIKEEQDDEILTEDAPVIVPEEQAELDTLFGDLGGSLQDELLTV